MRAKLTFDLPEHRDNFHAAIRGMDYYFALFDMDNLLRATARGENNILSNAKDKDAVADTLLQEFYNILDYHQIRIDEIS